MDFKLWISTLRELLQEQNNNLKLKNGHWQALDRKVLWGAIGSRIFDVHLDQLKECAVEVLIETDPKFELPAAERYAASIHGKILRHSSGLRVGMAESLALLGNFGGDLKNCSQGKSRSISVLAVREIFENAD